MNAEGKVAKVSVEAYLKHDASIDGKAEYYDGEIFDMAGGTSAHSRISANFIGATFGPLLGTSCIAHNSDQRVYIQVENAFVYPDVTIVCGDLESSDLDRNSILNPIVIVEALSPSTESFDRNGKFRRYMTIPSLKEYVLIAQDSMQVEVMEIVSPDMWTGRRYTEPNSMVQLKSLGIEIPLQLIYRGITFESQDDLTTAP